VRRRAKCTRGRGRGRCWALPLILYAHAHRPTSQLELNGVHFSPRRPWLFAVGGADCLARVFDMRRALPTGASADPDLPVVAGGSGTRVNAGGAAEAVRFRPATFGRSAWGGLDVQAPEPLASLRPPHMALRSRLHITAVQFSRAGELLATYNDDDLYLFCASVSM
jgi:DDB1- and CUL4-associated factor 8